MTCFTICYVLHVISMVEQDLQLGDAIGLHNDEKKCSKFYLEQP